MLSISVMNNILQSLSMQPTFLFLSWFKSFTGIHWMNSVSANVPFSYKREKGHYHNVQTNFFLGCAI